MSELPGFTSVALLGTEFGGIMRVGHKLVAPQRYPLAHFFHQSVPEPADGITEVYFRTLSNNVYRLDILRRLANVSNMKAAGRFVFRELPIQDLERQALYLGGQFQIGIGVNTNPLTEVVIAYGRGRGHLEALRQSQETSQIVQDFSVVPDILTGIVRR